MKKTILITLTIINFNLLCNSVNYNEFYSESESHVQYSQNPYDSIDNKSGSITDTIDVNAYYFRKSDEINTSYQNAQNEEIRKSPGSMEDVIRYFTGSPGVSIGSDINNELIVRGGSPVENLNVIDGLIIQNPNHYGSPGSTNGLLSYINLKLVKEIDFFTGGFPPEYGDRLSSVMNIKFREGESSRHIRDLNISATGFGGFFEGPLFKKASYMFSVRRSYYELIKKYLNTQLIPAYWDANLKLNLKISKTDKLSFTGLFATDNASPIEAGDFMYDTIDVNIFSAGVNYEKNLNENRLSLTAGYSTYSYDVNYQNFILDIRDKEISFNQKFTLNLSKQINLSIFSEARCFLSSYKVYHGSGFNASNFYTPALNYDDNIMAYKLGAGFNFMAGFFHRKLKFNFGLRADEFSILSHSPAFSPRMGITYSFTQVTSLSLNAGLYHQAPEMLWVLVDAWNRDLKYIKMFEVVLSGEHLFTADTRLIVEPYLKQYYDYPVSVYDPNYIFINSGVEIYPNFLDRATSSGRGYFAGLDVTIQKKNSAYGWFGSATFSLTKSGFLASKGDVQPAEFDYGSQVTLITGIKLNFGLSISCKFKYAKGRPYTPFDYSSSIANNRGIYNTDMYNNVRMPDYSRLDLRLEYSFKAGNFDFSSYLEVLNILDRVNYFNYYWSSYYKTQKANLQLPRVPILGLSVKF